ncbi:universal stress protein [Sphingomonas sp.]|uniref:universal stress protein n=1 Tax=Sphingomonas sp. TaxID=28214 RepID=UPI001D98FB88|nr:universal stress protein [Sphingomonas sp.]MBX9797505.1 universal stress protein [Sphingomonas sp.]
MKNILVLIHDDAGQEARLQVALDIARAMDGHLNCVDITMVPMLVSDYVSMGGGAMLLGDEQAAESANGARIRARLEREDVPFTWQDMTGDAATCLKEAARLVDLVVLNRVFDKALYPNMADLVGAMLTEGDVPVLAVPENARGLNVGGRALIAWDGSKDAEAALKTALPLLAHASEVTLLYADDGSITIPAEQGAIYLGRHGIPATVRREETGTDRPGTVILVEAATNADYLVMGGYGHARWLEAIFGGTTEKLLARSPVPVFLAHHR